MSRTISRTNFLTSGLLAVLMAGAAGVVDAQQYQDDYAFGYEPYSGDREFDAQVAAVNAVVSGDLEGFVEELVASYGAPRAEVRTLLIERHYPPDYLWTAAATAHTLERPWQQVFPVFEQNRGQGWGVVAKRLGIAPGSAEFHALKGDLSRRHGHWKTKKAKSPKAAKVADRHEGHGQADSHGKAKGNSKAKGKAKGKQK